MVSLSLVILGLATIGAYTKPTVRPSRGLELSLSTPANKVTSPSDLRVAATVKNAGDEDLKILKPGTVLDNEHPTPAFIVRKDGKEVPFIGITYQTTADGPSEDDWVVIPAGKNVTVEHDVSALYNFLASGPGTFTFDSVSRFQVIGINDSVETTPDVTPVDIANDRSVAISITQGVTDGLTDHGILSNCKSKDGSYVFNSAFEVLTMAGSAIAYIKENQDRDGFYKAYFGTNPTSDVIRNFDLIKNANTDTVTISCRDSVCSPKDGAKPRDAINPAGSKEIHFCAPFFDQKRLASLCDEGATANAGDLRGGTFLRMLARTFVPGVAGEGRTCDGAKELSDWGKITNNLNYECFAAEVYAKRECPH